MIVCRGCRTAWPGLDIWRDYDKCIKEGRIKEFKPKKAYKLMKALEDFGFRLPAVYRDFIEKEFWIVEGVIEVWECSLCGARVRMFVHSRGGYCCGMHPLKKVWKVPSRI